MKRIWNYIFICAAPRSGTTFLANMLGAADNAFALQKTPFKFRGREGVTTRHEMEKWIRKGDFILSNLSDQNFADLPCSNKEFYDEAVGRYIGDYFKKGSVPDFVIDHSPVNVMMSHILANTFPKAKFLHLVRDGRSAYNSVRNLPWGPSTPVAGARWWQAHVAPGLALERNLGEERVLRVHYEELVSDPAAVVRRICAFSGIVFSEQMLRGGGVLLSPYARDVHKNIGKAPIASRVEAWKETLPKSEQSYFSEVNAALLSNLGYSVPEDTWLSRASIIKKASWSIREISMAYAINPVRNRLRRVGSRSVLNNKDQKKVS